MESVFLNAFYTFSGLIGCFTVQRVVITWSKYEELLYMLRQIITSSNYLRVLIEMYVENGKNIYIPVLHCKPDVLLCIYNC